MLDPDRLIFYGGTAPGGDQPGDEAVQFFAYDVKNRKLLYAGPDGPAGLDDLRQAPPAASTTSPAREAKAAAHAVTTPPGAEPPVKVEGTRIGVRAATQETPQGIVYTASFGQKDGGGRSLVVRHRRPSRSRTSARLAAGRQSYVASVDADPTGRYLYYVPGAHGASDRDGSAVVQFDVEDRRQEGASPSCTRTTSRSTASHARVGTYSGRRRSPEGDKLYVTWNVPRIIARLLTLGLTLSGGLASRPGGRPAWAPSRRRTRTRGR